MPRPVQHIFDPAALRGKWLRIASPEIPGSRSLHYLMIATGVYKAKKLGKATYIDGTSVADALEFGPDAMVRVPPTPPSRGRTGRPVGRPRKVRPEAAVAEATAQ